MVMYSTRTRIRTRPLTLAPQVWAGRGDAYRPLLLTLSLTLSLTHTHSLSLSHTQTHTHTHNLSLSHTRTHTYARTLSLSHTRTLSPPNRYGRDVAMLTDLVRCSVVAEDLHQVASRER